MTWSRDVIAWSHHFHNFLLHPPYNLSALQLVQYCPFSLMKNYSRHSVGEVPRVPKSPLADDLTGALVVVYKMSIILFVIEREREG